MKKFLVTFYFDSSMTKEIKLDENGILDMKNHLKSNNFNGLMEQIDNRINTITIINWSLVETVIIEEIID